MNLLETLKYYNLDLQNPRPTFQGPFGTDKELWGYISLFYKDFFEPYKYLDIKLVEIGTMYGGSLLLWEKFFKNADITGIELNPHHEFYIPNISKDKENNLPYESFGLSEVKFEDYLKKSKIRFYKEDAYKIEFVNRIFEDDSIDIILDDGPHTLHFQKLAADLYYQKLKKNGYLIIEDVTTNDVDELIRHCRNVCEGSLVEHSFNKSDLKKPWGNSIFFNIVTIKKI